MIYDVVIFIEIIYFHIHFKSSYQITAIYKKPLIWDFSFPWYHWNTETTCMIDGYTHYNVHDMGGCDGVIYRCIDRDMEGERDICLKIYYPPN